MDRSDNYNTDYTSHTYYRTLVEWRQKANYLLTRVEANKDPELQEEFKWFMKLLIREMKPKYMRREDVEKPDELENSDKKVEDMSLKELREVLENICILQEKLGITSRATQEWEMEEKGAENKEDD